MAADAQWCVRVAELLKINHYKAPRDKLICILNCCKVIFGLIRHLGSDENVSGRAPPMQPSYRHDHR